MGYAIPGLVLAVGIIQFFSFLDNNFLRSYFDLILTDPLWPFNGLHHKILCFSKQFIESGYERINDAIDDVSLSLKVSS